MATAAPEAADTPVLWITASQGCEILRVNPKQFKAITTTGGIRTLRVPGTRVRFALPDVMAMADAARQPREAMTCA